MHVPWVTEKGLPKQKKVHNHEAQLHRDASQQAFVWHCVLRRRTCPVLSILLLISCGQKYTEQDKFLRLPVQKLSFSPVFHILTLGLGV